ncbi:MAG: RloB domain-containing protein [Crocinitomicaceae bacterium]|nr:RloB domain-containing protein [Crocinitomicaceae bacterium]
MKEKFSFKDFVEELKKSATENVSKNPDSKEERRYFLIVTEGEKTEPNYFNKFKSFLPKNLLSTIELIGEGDNTINIVNKAIKEKNKRQADPINPDYDEVWAVFDKDSFPNYRVDNAVNIAEASGIEPALSNQAFELWYVLHFQYLDSDLHRSVYFDILSSFLETKYEKNTEKIIDLIWNKGNVEQAIKWAKILEENAKGNTPSNSIPTTRVYKLVENLLNYIEKNKK